jgi:hypothetical protein
LGALGPLESGALEEYAKEDLEELVTPKFSSDQSVFEQYEDLK